ncbi:MAG TPA: hypothetical protein VL943_09875, partial [Niabella sp.]|nr:hypothetical protein [Niabella sp.]
AYRAVHIHCPLWYYRSSKDESAIIEKFSSLAELFQHGILISTTLLFEAIGINEPEDRYCV